MNEHLRPEHFVEALDGVLTASARVHLDACDTCRAELASLRAVVLETQQVDPPAPSPLFWDHFSSRVRAATAGSSVPPPVPWWREWWRPVTVVSGAIAIMAVVVALRPDSAGVPSAAPDAFAETDDGTWDLVIGLAAELDRAEVKEAVRPVDGTADAMIADLTSAQREELVRLLQREMGEQ